MEQSYLDPNISFISNNDEFKYYSQDYGNGEVPMDKFILDNYINYWKDSSKKSDNVNGVFLELGGFDGVTYSNTKTMEDHLNFTGTLIEASLSNYYKMFISRPACKNHNYAVSNVDEKFLSFTGDDLAVGGLTHILETAVQSSGRDWITAWNLSTNTIDVPVKKLSDILKEDNVTYIDFFSLDVIGSELEVLESMDWDIPVYIIVIEVSAWGKAGKEMIKKCREILKDKGFEMKFKGQLDEVWINNSYFRKDLLTLS